MKKHGVDHDGSEEMLYPAGVTYEILRKEQAKADQSAKRRQELSEARKEKRETKVQGVISDKGISQVLDIAISEVKSVRAEFSLIEKPLSRDAFNKFMDAGGKKKVRDFITTLRAEKEITNKQRKAEEHKLYMSQSEICQFFQIDRYDIKVAVQTGLLNPVNKKFLRRDIEVMDPKDFNQKLIWERQHPTSYAARLLNISVNNFLRLVEKHDLSPTDSSNIGLLWRYGDFISLANTDEVKEMIAASDRSRRQAWENERTSVALLEEEIIDTRARITANVQVGIRDRHNAPEYVALHLGPTNSGKTYNALENLCEEYEKNPVGTYVYAGPLRMLAFEVYEKLVERYGAENVGFLTGEEQVNPDAPILATTVEMAPTEGDVLIIDEAHWVIDDARGHYWTKLLIGAKYRRIHVIAAREVKDDILPLVSDAWEVESFEYQRRTGITFEGTIPLEKVPAKTAVVCFSRKSVYAMAGALRDAGKNVGVLYGALPLYARKEQIRKFVAGEFDVIVTTDVIGHGINLPIDNVVFAETEKFDGKVRRDIHSWEAGQIAGRAGRFGLSDKGRVYLVSGRQWFSVDTDLVKEGVAVAAGLVPSDLMVDKPLIAPRFNDLRLLDNDHKYLNFALEVWKEKALRILEPRGIKPASLETLIKNLDAVTLTLGCDQMEYGFESGSYSLGDLQDMTKNQGWKIPLENVWQLVSGPFDSESPVLEATARWLNDGASTSSPIMQECFKDHIHYGAFVDTENMECLEQACKFNGEMKMSALMFADEGRLGFFHTRKLEKAEHSINAKIVKLLANDSQNNSFGVCGDCGEECLPWFKLCNVCYGT